MKRYSPRTDEAIWALMCERHDDGRPRWTSLEIWEKLRKGDAAAGLDPCDMPRRTFFEHRKRLLEDRGEPVPALPTDTDAADLARAAERSLLELVHQDIAKLRRKQRNGGLTIKDAGLIDRHLKTLADVRHRASRRKELSISSNQVNRAQAASIGTPRGSLLERLQRDREQS